MFESLISNRIAASGNSEIIDARQKDKVTSYWSCKDKNKPSVVTSSVQNTDNSTNKGMPVVTISNYTGIDLGKWPVPGVYRISSAHGWRNDPQTGERRMHDGIDIAPPSGTTPPVFSVSSGEAYRDSDISGKNIRGNYVVVTNGNKVYNYLHLSAIASGIGTKDAPSLIKEGDPIGNIGSTGRSTGNHLHFSLYVSGVNIDPMTILRKS